jgi:SanA protein
MLWKIIRGLLRGLLAVILLSLLLFGLPRLVTGLYARMRVSTVAGAPAEPVGIVFGAGLSRSGTPSPVLRDRIETAAELYAAGKIEKILMSGDNRFVSYNEPGAMRSYALELGVPDEDIVLDFAGRRTYDTCYRARHIFGVRQAILITQSFHMPRAVYLCNHLDVTSVGVPADIRRYGRRSYAYWNIREIPATAVALWEVWVSRPLPVLGKPEPIFDSFFYGDFVLIENNRR